MKPFSFLLFLLFAAVTAFGADNQIGGPKYISGNKSQVSLAGSFSNITTATTTVVKNESGVLQSVVVNTAGVGSTITIYDSLTATGTKIATLTSAAQSVILYNVRFATGLTVVTASGTPADITVSYR